MADLKSGISRSGPGNDRKGKGNCILHIRNRSGSRLNLVLHGTEVNIVRAMTVRRFKRLKLIKGTYVVEAWLSEGRIGINAVNIPHISIEKITSRKDVSIRGRKIVADFVNDRARLEIDQEPTAGDIVQNI
ncbi:MAG: hypothetical protein KAR19_17775 [Bacteroidales bacterium]|nr:hypothetical protein [Bacteroidales bacterium]